MSNGNYQYAPPPPQGGQPMQPGQQAHQPAPQQHTDTATQYCRDCGQPVQPGSAVCLNCNYILDRDAFRRAQQLVGRRNRQKMQPRNVRPQQPYPQPGQRFAQPGQRGGKARGQGAETAEAIGAAVVSILRRYDILPQPTQRNYPNTPNVAPPIQQPQPAVQDMPDLDLGDAEKAAKPPQPAKFPDATDPAAVQAALPKAAAAQPRYHFNTSGDVFCPKCGTEVDLGACQCIHCGYVIDEAQYAIAMQQMNDRNAELEHKDLVKSYLVPGYGKKMYEEHHLRRPQIAEPCLKAGKINKAMLTLSLILLILLLIFLA